MSSKLVRCPQWLWMPLASVVALLPAAVLAVTTHELFLFASLGPTAVIVIQQPENRSARAYNVIVGHAAGMIAGFACVWVLGLSHAPSVFMLQDVSVLRATAALGAVAMAAVLEFLLKAQHPPAASTTLLVALGSFHPIWRDTVAILGGVIMVAAAAEFLRRQRLA